MVTRRDFIKAAAVVTAGTLIHNEAPAFLMQRKPKVIVLGAGLAAAYALRKKGCEVTILEARKRVGGRVFSHPSMRRRISWWSLASEQNRDTASRVPGRNSTAMKYNRD